MHIEPYLFFEGSCEKALAFYKAHLGAEIHMMMRFEDAPDPKPPVDGNKIMHASFKVGTTYVLASDGHCSGTPAMTGFSLCLAVSTAEEANRLHAILGEGGQVRMPIAETFFSPGFGIVVDQFGVTWMIMTEPSGQA